MITLQLDAKEYIAGLEELGKAWERRDLTWFEIVHDVIDNIAYDQGYDTLQDPQDNEFLFND